MTTLRVSDAFPSKYLKAEDLKGQTAHLTIDHVEMDDVGDDRKPIAYFQDAKKGLVVNVTNARAIATLAGDDMDTWAGMPIELVSTPVSYQGRTVDAIRAEGAGISSRTGRFAPQAWSIRGVGRIVPSRLDRRAGASDRSLGVGHFAGGDVSLR